MDEILQVFGTLLKYLKLLSAVNATGPVSPCYLLDLCSV